MKSIGAWFEAWGKAIIEGRQKSADRQIAMMQLHRMTDRELNDIGITRGDIRRVLSE